MLAAVANEPVTAVAAGTTVVARDDVAAGSAV
jgi:hypothetical protein